jgi:hypothetical protein
LATPTNIDAIRLLLFSFFLIEVEVRKIFQMATTTGPTATSVTRGNSNQSSLGALAPLNTPTRRFYGLHGQSEIREPGVSNPNIYVVQPFKNASVPKDLIYAKKVIKYQKLNFKINIIN